MNFLHDRNRVDISMIHRYHLLERNIFKQHVTGNGKRKVACGSHRENIFCFHRGIPRPNLELSFVISRNIFADTIIRQAEILGHDIVDVAICVGFGICFCPSNKLNHFSDRLSEVGGLIGIDQGLFERSQKLFVCRDCVIHCLSFLKFIFKSDHCRDCFIPRKVVQTLFVDVINEISDRGIEKERLYFIERRESIFGKKILLIRRQSLKRIYRLL